MKVIVAGYPKTGTKSMNAALTELGYNVYDAMENLVWLEDEYTKIFSEGWTTEDFRKMYENVDAVVDYPACFFWDEIHKVFPDAKIILTVREDEDTWCKSLKVQLQAQQQLKIRFFSMFSRTFMRVGRNISQKAFPIVLGIKHPSVWSSGVQMNAEMAKKCYRSHNAYVIQTAPKDKLLIFKCSEGWKPLCQFLNLPVPSTPFPHRNIKGNVVNEMDENPIIKEMSREISRNLALCTVTTGVITYCSFKYGPVFIVREGCNHLWSLFEKLWGFAH